MCFLIQQKHVEHIEIPKKSSEAQVHTREALILIQEIRKETIHTWSELMKCCDFCRLVRVFKIGSNKNFTRKIAKSPIGFSNDDAFLVHSWRLAFKFTLCQTCSIHIIHYFGDIRQFESVTSKDSTKIIKQSIIVWTYIKCLGYFRKCIFNHSTTVAVP